MYNNFQETKMTKSTVEIFLSIILQVPIQNLAFERLSERPKIWKHSCTPTGVTILVPRRDFFNGFFAIDFAVCPMCGKVLYYFEG